MTYQELRKIILSKGYVWFDTGDLNLNIIGLRLSDTLTNKFTDTLYIAYKVQGEELILNLPCSTKPGLYGDKAALNPIPGGVAILVPNQYRTSWQWIEVSNAKYPFNGEYFQQIKNVEVWRDANKDTKVDHQGNQLGKFGINIHKGSKPVKVGGNVDNWSCGCQVLEEPSFQKLVPLIREAVKRYGYLFTYTLIDWQDLPTK